MYINRNKNLGYRGLTDSGRGKLGNGWELRRLLWAGEWEHVTNMLLPLLNSIPCLQAVDYTFQLSLQSQSPKPKLCLPEDRGGRVFPFSFHNQLQVLNSSNEKVLLSGYKAKGSSWGIKKERRSTHSFMFVTLGIGEVRGSLHL